MSLSQQELDYIDEFRDKNLFKKSYFKNVIICHLNEIVTSVLQERTGKTLLYWFEHKLQDYLQCPICGNQLKRIKPGKSEYAKVCSAKCAGHYTNSNSTPEQRKSAALKVAEKYRNKSIDEKSIIALKVKSTMIARYGEDNPTKIKKFREKAKSTNLKKYGVENPMQNADIIKKSVETKKEIYGEHFELIVEKQEKTMLERYGFRRPNQVYEFNEKTKATNLKRYGCTWNIASDESREKQKNTCIEKYGVSSPMMNEDFKKAYRETIFRKYGFYNISQIPEIHTKKLKTGYQSKVFVFPSGKEVLVQGYEDKALLILLNEYKEDEIIVEQNLIPAIPWIDKHGKDRIYLPDIFIPKNNLIIEVKSEYTYLADLENNLLKKKFTEISGFNFEFMVI